MMYLQIHAKNLLHWQARLQQALNVISRRRQRKGTLAHWLFASVLTLVGLQGLCVPMTSQVNLVVQSPMHPHSFTFKDGGQALYYAFTLGAPSADSALVFFVSGSGCATVKGRFPGYFDPIKNQLNARVIVLQKRGIQENSDGDTCSPVFAQTDYFEQTVADQLEFINDRLASEPIKPQSIVLIGASEGAVVAAKIASVDSRITQLALIGGGGTTLRENLQLLAQKIWYLRSPEARFAAIAKDPASTTQTVWGHSYKYWSSLLDVDIGDFLLSLDIPIVMAMGEQDESVPIQTAYALQQKFERQKKINLFLYAFPNSDHRLYDRTREISHVKEFLEGLVVQINKKKSP